MSCTTFDFFESSSSGEDLKISSSKDSKSKRRSSLSGSRVNKRTTPSPLLNKLKSPSSESSLKRKGTPTFIQQLSSKKKKRNIADASRLSEVSFVNDSSSTSQEEKLSPNKSKLIINNENNNESTSSFVPLLQNITPPTQKQKRKRPRRKVRESLQYLDELPESPILRNQSSINFSSSFRDNTITTSINNTEQQEEEQEERSLNFPLDIAYDDSNKEEEDPICSVCHREENDAELLLCDGCPTSCHTYCEIPRLREVPKGDWFCSECMKKKRTLSVFRDQPVIVDQENVQIETNPVVAAASSSSSSSSTDNEQVERNNLNAKVFVELQLNQLPKIPKRMGGQGIWKKNKRMKSINKKESTTHMNKKQKKQQEDKEFDYIAENKEIKMYFDHIDAKGMNDFFELE